MLSSKEGLILLSGTTSVTAFASLAIYDAQTLSLTADIAGAFTLEVLKGTLMAMDERLMAVRPHPDQINTAANIRAILKDSPMLERYRGHRVQDALSIRCMPQLHGPGSKRPSRTRRRRSPSSSTRPSTTRSSSMKRTAARSR